MDDDGRRLLFDRHSIWTESIMRLAKQWQNMIVALLKFLQRHKMHILYAYINNRLTERATHCELFDLDNGVEYDAVWRLRFAQNANDNERWILRLLLYHAVRLSRTEWPQSYWRKFPFVILRMRFVWGRVAFMGTDGIWYCENSIA